MANDISLSEGEIVSEGGLKVPVSALRDDGTYVPLPTGSAGVGKVPTVTAVSPLALGWATPGGGSGGASVFGPFTIDFDSPGINGVNEVQTVHITGGPSGGTFTLTVAGQDTGPMAFDITTGDFQALVSASVLVGGSNPNFTLTYQGDNPTQPDAGGQPHSLAILTDNSLSGGTSPSVAIARSVAGVLAEGFPLFTPADGDLLMWPITLGLPLDGGPTPFDNGQLYLSSLGDGGVHDHALANNALRADGSGNWVQFESGNIDGAMTNATPVVAIHVGPAATEGSYQVYFMRATPVAP